MFINFCPLCLRIIRHPKSYWYLKVSTVSNSISRTRTAVLARRIHMSSVRNVKNEIPDMQSFPVERIRNFSIIAHVDHGKSTLADRLLEHTGTISKDGKNEQVLDKLQVERERGITVKAQTASLIYKYKNESQPYLLNLVDTPGHVDFNYEVSRSLAACQGVILLVDANQGVQAQTLANFYLAFEAELYIVPVMNKIDLKVARPDEVSKQMQTLFDVKESDILRVSAKNGIGIEAVLEAVVEQIPPPLSDDTKPLKMLLFDSSYDRFRGVSANVVIMDGAIRKGDKIVAAHNQQTYEVQEIGIMYPDECRTNILCAGQVGYLYAHIKDATEAQIGDTFYHVDHPVEPLPGFRVSKPMVFSGVFPSDQSEFVALKNALDKLKLNDSSLHINTDSSSVLGQGFRLGFLGLLHMDVFSERLEQEYQANVIMTSPNVPYRVKIFGEKNIKKYKGEDVEILNPCHLPDESIVVQYEEPMVMSTIITPEDYLSAIMRLIQDRRGDQVDQSYIDGNRVMFKVIFPLNEIIIDFFNALKSNTSGYASFDYEDHGFRITTLKKIEILMNQKPVEELTQIAHVSKTREVAKHMVNKLKEHIPRQLFEIAIQAKVNGKVIARENIKPFRKDVLAKCYGGDVTRKMKLLRQQAEGKKRMRQIGNISVPRDIFIKILQK